MKTELDLFRNRLWNPMLNVDDMMSPFFSRQGKTDDTFSPACDITEEDSRYLMTLDIPGLGTEDVKIEVIDHHLVVSGERREQRSAQKEGSHSVERFQGHFRRSFSFPSTVDAGEIEASYRDGVLSVTLPKRASVQPRQIPIRESKTVAPLRAGDRAEKVRSAIGR